MVLFQLHLGYSINDGSVHFSNPKKDFFHIFITCLQACDSQMLSALASTLVGNVWFGN